MPLRERRDTMQLEIGSQWGPSQKPECKLEPGSPGVPSGSYGGSCLTSQPTPTTPLQGVSPRWAPAWSCCLSGIYTAWRINSSGQEWLRRKSAAQRKGRGQNSEKCLGTSLNQLSSTWGTLCLRVQKDFPGTTTYGEFLKSINFQILNFHINSFLKTICLRMCLGCSTPPHLFQIFLFLFYILKNPKHMLYVLLL